MQQESHASAATVNFRLTTAQLLRNPHRMAKVVIVFHMGRQCSHCVEYMPRFKAAAQKYKGKLDIRHVNVTQSVKAVQELAAKLKITGAPTTVVLDEKDKVLKRKVGAVDNAEIDALLAFAAS
jgi:thiol-disulfide isomerase/thioredoxin